MTTHSVYNRAVDLRTHAYTILFLSLTALMFVGPVLVELQIGKLVHGLVLMTILAAAMYGIGNSRTTAHLAYWPDRSYSGRIDSNTRSTNICRIFYQHIDDRLQGLVFTLTVGKCRPMGGDLSVRTGTTG